MTLQKETARMGIGAVTKHFQADHSATVLDFKGVMFVKTPELLLEVTSKKLPDHMSSYEVAIATPENIHAYINYNIIVLHNGTDSPGVWEIDFPTIFNQTLYPPIYFWDGFDPPSLLYPVEQNELIPSAWADALKKLSLTEPIFFQGKPVPQRKWLVDGWIPWLNTTALYGDGGVGKTLLAHMLATSAATDKSWLGMGVTPCRVLAVFCEDDNEELHRRQADINKVMGLEFSDLKNFRWISRVGQDNLLMTFDGRQENGAGKLTPFWHHIVESAKSFGAQFVIIDTAADCFGGNENSRPQVRQFIQNACTRLAIEIDGAVLLCAHPSVSGMQRGDGLSGSTGWNNSVRARLFLERPKAEAGDAALDYDQEARILTKKKANYSSVGDNLALEWRDGVFRALDMPGKNVMSNIAKQAIENKNKDVFLKCLDITAAQGRSATDAKQSSRYAPKLFAGMPEAKGLKKHDMVKAMESLFNEGKIRIDSVAGPDRHRIKAIVRVTESAGGVSAGSAVSHGANH